MSTDVTAVAGPLAHIFRTNGALLTKAFEGVGDDQLWHRPSQQNNPILWIAGHVVGTRALMLQVLGEPFETGWGTLFARGAALGDEALYPSKAEVLRVHDALTPRLHATLHALSGAALERDAVVGPKPPGVKSVGEQIGFFALHDSYHLGQMGYIRKALGLPGLVG